MKRLKLSQISFALFFLIIFTGCEFIGDVFEAGVWVGAFIVIAIVLFALWLLAKMMR